MKREKTKKRETKHFFAKRLPIVGSKMSPSPPSASLAEALASGDLASAIRFLDRTVEAEEKRQKDEAEEKRQKDEEASMSTTTAINKTNGVDVTSSSSSSSSARLANALTSRALCHERLGMLRKALKVRSRVFSGQERALSLSAREGRKSERAGREGDKSMHRPLS